jgi:hypothetical protein
MNLQSLRLLTWATIAGSVASALLLASGELRAPLPRATRAVVQAPAQGGAAKSPAPLPSEPTAAGARPVAKRDATAP